ncbi:MAG: hypothetical protein M0R03_22940, partial [Novosphingobium sp.]|nr:hypothetical protein [Novosphingobium sp.]
MKKDCIKCGTEISIKKNTPGHLVLCKSCKQEKDKKICLNCGNIFYSEKSKRKFCSRSCSSIYNLTGRSLTKSHKENLSKSAGLKSSGIVRTKFYKIFCPFLNRKISVQGGYEFKYAQYLNENNIPWD